MKKLMTVILALSVTMCLCACAQAETSSLDTDSPANAGTSEAAEATTEVGSAEAEEVQVTLPDDNGMAGIYKWIEMEDYGLKTYLILWDDGIGSTDIVGTGTVRGVFYDDETMQVADEGTVPQKYTYADGKLIWTYTDEGGEHTSTFVKLTADERAAYEALGVGTIVETEEDFVEQGEDRVQEDSAGDTLYQVALLQSLVQGYYDGIITVGELKQHGDTGIGTFEGVNGEMIVLDGVVYQAISDGSIAIPADEETVPFSNVTFFDVDETLALSGIADMAALQEAMNGVVSELGANCFYMVKIDGTFESIKVRSEYKQEKPYRMLDEALAEDQTEFDYQDICGTMVGLYCPDYMGGLNSVGWHFHFINEDRTRGGHVLQVSVAEAEASFDMTDGFEMTLSRNAVFQDMALAKDEDEAIHRAETATTGKN